MNLTEVIHDPKYEVKAPSLDYVRQPKINCNSLLKDARKKELLGELKNNEQYFDKHQDARARIDSRENCYLRLQADKPPGMTMADVNDRRKNDLINDMLSKFGNVTVGIHGQELPKFAQTDESK